MDTNSIISLMNVITPEVPQVPADSGSIDENASADFSEILEQAQVQTQQTPHQDEFASSLEPLESPSQSQSTQDENEQIAENVQETADQTPLTQNEPSDNNYIEEPTDQLSDQNAQNIETLPQRKALENTEHLVGKKNFTRLAEQMPKWSNSIILAQAGITRQPPPGKAESAQQSVFSNEEDANNLQTTSSGENHITKTNIQANTTIQTNNNLNSQLTNGTISETSDSPNVPSSDYPQPGELAVDITLIQTEQNQGQSLSVQNTAAQPHLPDVIEKASLTEKPENVIQQQPAENPAAPVMVDKEQQQQDTYQPENISGAQEPKAPTQVYQQPSMEYNMVNNNTAQTIILEDITTTPQVPQNSPTTIQQGTQATVPETSIDSQPVTEKSTIDGSTENNQNLTKQQVTDSKFNTESLMQNSNNDQLQVTNVQKTNLTEQTTETNIESTLQKMVSAEPEQNQNIESSILPQQTENPNAGVLLNAASAKVSQQIQESIQSSFGDNQQQITIRLQPPELGKVYIKFEQQGDDIIGQLEVTKTETRMQIIQQLPEMIRNLAEAGIQIKRIEVNLADQYPRQGDKEQTEQDMFLRDQDNLNQHYHWQQDSDTPDFSQSQQWVAVDQYYQNQFDQPNQNLALEGSLNILV